MKGGEGNAFAKKFQLLSFEIIALLSLLLLDPLDLPPVDNPRRAARRRLDKGCFVLGTVFLAFRIPDQLG